MKSRNFIDLSDFFQSQILELGNLVLCLKNEVKNNGAVDLPKKDLQPSSELVALASGNHSESHHLPARRGKNVAKGFLEKNREFIFRQSENKMCAQIALLNSIIYIVR
jgi:aspartate carbamoyltransferase catalytic subunit